MGYTHYWRIEGPVDLKLYARALTDIRKIIRLAGKSIPLGNDAGDRGTTPELRNGVSFNGIDDHSHETFHLPKDPATILDGFDFCKTAQKPYDTAVVACLTRLAEVPGFSVSSDGTPEEWTDGVALYIKALDREPSIPAGVRREEA